MHDMVTLRPVTDDQLPRLLALLTDASAAGEFQWFGPRLSRAKELEHRWHIDGLIGPEESFLAVGLSDGACAGWVTWRRAGQFGNFEIGIALFPEHRGLGIGTEAQRLLVEHLFGTTSAHRLQAGTEVGSLAERRALERVGFRCEGVQRGAAFRAGQWRDGALYGLVRGDWEAARVAPEQGAANQEVSIRAATQGDIPAVLDLWRVAGTAPTHTDDVTSVERLVSHDPGALLVVDADGHIVGSVIARWDGWRGSVYRLAVAPSHRRRGLGRRLVAAAERRLQEKGASRLQAIVVQTEHHATGFWRSTGWEEQVERLRFVRG